MKIMCQEEREERREAKRRHVDTTAVEEENGGNVEVEQIKAGMFLGAMNLNEYDLSSTHVQNWIFKSVQEKSVNLIMFNTTAYQASLQHHGRVSGKDSKGAVVNKIASTCNSLKDWCGYSAELIYTSLLKDRSHTQRLSRENEA